jgi:hypothetical protein
MLSRLQGIIGAQIVFNITFYGGTIMVIVNVEGAIFKNDTWLIIERSKKEEHAGGMLSLVGGKTEVEGNNIRYIRKNSET